MLQIDKVQTIQGVTVFGDADPDAYSTFYLLPEQPRYRIGEDGNPLFRFLLYRTAVDKPDGVKAGGFLIFDAEFVVPEAKLPLIEQELQSQVDRVAAARGVAPPAVEIGTISYLDGSASVNVFNGTGDLVQKVFNPAKPSLIGKNITPFSVEFSPDGAALAKQALQGKGGVVQVSYKLVFWAKVPPLHVTASFNSNRFYSFVQTIDVDWHVYASDSYRESLREQAISADAMAVDIDPGGVDPAIVAEVSDWAFRTLEKSVERRMIEQLTPDPDDQRKLPDGIEDVTRDISKTSVASFALSVTEAATVEWDVYPQGTLPNITSLFGRDGEPLKWEDFATEVNVDDPFFKELRVDVMVNADFALLPIHSVEVKLRYKGKPMPALAEGPEGEAIFRDAATIAKFATFVEGDDFSYQYSYEVNFEGTSRTFKSDPIVADDGVITVGVDDVGILLVDVGPGDINWTEVKSAQVRLTYEDLAESVGPLEEQFVLTQDKPEHQFKEVIFKPFRKEYAYQVTYSMHDGREFRTAEQRGRSHSLFINDPFAGRKTIKVLGVGDFTNAIENVFIDLEYRDDANNYRQQKSVVLNADTLFADWVFPVIDETLGTTSYSGTVMLKNATTRSIPATVTTASTIIVPKAPVDNLDVQVVADLLDFAVVKLARVSLSYVDDANLATATKDFVFSQAASKPATARFAIFDATRKRYSWKAQFFMADGSRRDAGVSDVTDSVLILELPA